MNITIFGYGNDSRMDDGVAFSLAPRIARYLEGRGHRVALSLEHQLLPEAAAELKDADFAIFVDASMENSAEGFRIRPVEAREILEGLNLHTVGPEWVLAMGQRIHGRIPDAWLVTVEGEQFDFGNELTPACAERAERALHAFRATWEERFDA
ncbi:MAG: hydrogenase maturation protease [Synergistaceae bacterium]|jgi:hydrogenase maturation protease|nr:hydrogenase maturation protease [Synergistaceae bacterium]